MNFLRPEAIALLRRWAETALSGLVLVVLLWTGGAMIWVGALMGGVILVIAIGAAFWFQAALARARLGVAPPGPGVVVVDERRIGYMGPESGAFVALDSLEGVDIVAGRRGAEPLWVLRPDDGPALAIPVGAEGAGALFEAFAALPGFSYDRAVAAMSGRLGNRPQVWRRRAEAEASGLASSARRH